MRHQHVTVRDIDIHIGVGDDATAGGVGADSGGERFFSGAGRKNRRIVKKLGYLIEKERNVRNKWQ